MTKKSQNPKPNKKKTYYHLKAWKALRLEILSLNPYCKMCSDKGIVTKATHIDHIDGFKNKKQFFNTKRLQPLCLPCHNRKTHTAGGEDWTRRHQAKLGIMKHWDY